MSGSLASASSKRAPVGSNVPRIAPSGLAALLNSTTQRSSPILPSGPSPNAATSMPSSPKRTSTETSVPAPMSASARFSPFFSSTAMLALSNDVFGVGTDRQSSGRMACSRSSTVRPVARSPSALSSQSPPSPRFRDAMTMPVCAPCSVSE